MIMIENFGQNIKRLRQKHQITQEDLAIAIEVQKQAISNIERGKSYPSFENLDRIARFFNVSAVDLFGTPAEIEISSTTAILDRIDEYTDKTEHLFRLMHRIDDFSPRQIDGLSDQVHEIMSYFQPYTKINEDGTPETDNNDRPIVRQSKYRQLPIKKINALYNKINTINAYHQTQKNHLQKKMINEW